MGKRSQSQERWKKRHSPQPSTTGQRTIQRMRPRNSSILAFMLAAEMMANVRKER